MVDRSAYVARLRDRVLDLTYKGIRVAQVPGSAPRPSVHQGAVAAGSLGLRLLRGTRTVDVHVRRLRAKLGPEHESLIGTVRNVGYRFVEADDEVAVD